MALHLQRTTNATRERYINESQRMMVKFTLQKVCRIKNKWISDGLSEIMCTFMLAFFIFASGAQATLTKNTELMGRALAAGVGLMNAVYCGYSASGGLLNPCITLMFCLTGKLPWKKYPLYVPCQFVGAFIGAAVTYGLYYESLFHDREQDFANVFATFPAPGVSTLTGFFDVAMGCGLLTGCTCMLIDPNNAKTASGVIPIALIFLVYGIVMCVGVQTGAPLNFAVDLSGRLFAALVGYKSFQRENVSDYWFLVVPAGCYTGTIIMVTTYQLLIGNHLPDANHDYTERDNEDRKANEENDTDLEIRRATLQSESCSVLDGVNESDPRGFNGIHGANLNGYTMNE
ncbi:hypothetical protein DPMN_009399 [Dreissena polymorpha]|uniref:Uncharacterized protein n=1 Tax=Dreissena polymorpha TaxID=45954 RepID=A0A9D4RY15_DREPO|nr:hypothetical protein DPMN_009399 [Dreissena polymorpha]